MWYTDPFIALPVAFMTAALTTIGGTVYTAKTGRVWTAKLSAVVFGAFMSAAVFLLVFGYMLRNPI